jgi:hypothetical protein
MKKIPMLEKFAAQSLVESDGELVFSKEKFAELIVRECLEQIDKIRDGCEDDGEDQQALGADWAGLAVARHFGVEE